MSYSFERRVRHGVVGVTTFARNHPIDTAVCLDKRLYHKLSAGGVAMIDKDKTHDLHAPHAKHAHPAHAAPGQPAFVATDEECFENLSKVYLGAKAVAFRQLWNETRFKSRIVIAGGSVLLSALAGTANLTHTHRDSTSKPLLPVDVVSYGGTDLDMFFLRDWSCTHSENELLLREWCVALADLFSDDPSVHTLWLNGATFNIVRCGAPILQVVLRICKDINFVSSFDIFPCRFVLMNANGLLLGATFEAMDSVTTRSFPVVEGTSLSRVTKYVERGFALLVPRGSSTAWLSNVSGIEQGTACSVMHRPPTFGTADTTASWGSWEKDMLRWVTRCSDIGIVHANID